MAEIGLRSKMLVKDVMSSPVVTISEDSTANRAAELMETDKLGCIIVTTKEGKPLGVITERDLVVRVLAKNLKPDAARSGEVMTSPLITIEPDATIAEAARRMSRLDVRRLGVIYKGQLIGLLSSKDILAVVPDLLETIPEKTLIQRENETEEEEKEPAPLAGYCDRCGGWSEDLKDVNGQFLCEDCRVEVASEEE